MSQIKLSLFSKNFYSVIQNQHSGFTPLCTGKLAFWENDTPWPVLFVTGRSVNACTGADSKQQTLCDWGWSSRGKRSVKSTPLSRCRPGPARPCCLLSFLPLLLARLSVSCTLALFLLFCSWPCPMACESLLPWPGAESEPLQWELRVFITGPARNARPPLWHRSSSYTHHPAATPTISRQAFAPPF